VINCASESARQSASGRSILSQSITDPTKRRSALRHQALQRVARRSGVEVMDIPIFLSDPVALHQRIE
jgi:hypothetical protein